MFSKDFAQPYVQQGRLGVERELFANTSLSVSYLYFHGVHIGRTRDINLAAPVPTTVTDPAGQTFTVLRHPAVRPIPGFARINLFESTGDSRYNALCNRIAAAVYARISVHRGLHVLGHERQPARSDDGRCRRRR